MQHNHRDPVSRICILRMQWMLTALLLLAPAVLSAAPAVTNVSGDFETGQSITISGSGFGTRANYNEGGFSWYGRFPLTAKFKDFEDGSKISGGWEDGFPAQNAIQSGGRIAGGKYLREIYVSDERTWFQYTMTKAIGKWYVTFWFMMPPDTQGGKLWRIYGTPGSANNIYLGSGGPLGRKLRGYSECNTADCSPVTEWGTGADFIDNTWHRIEIYMDDSTNTFTTYIDGILQWTKNDWVAYPFSGNGHTMDFGNSISGPSRGEGTAGSYNYDDIYVDYTLARVELCQGSTWSGKGKCEIQIPIAWPNGEDPITVSANTGSFTAGQTVYLYVVNADGEANSSGYPVKIGDRIPSALPEAPEGLTVE